MEKKKRVEWKEENGKKWVWTIFLTIHCPCFPTILFPYLQTHCTADSGCFSPNFDKKNALSAQARWKVYKELRLNTELQRSVFAFSGKLPIWFRLRWGNGQWFLANIHHRLQNESNISHMVYFIFRMSENSLEDFLQATISLLSISF